MTDNAAKKAARKHQQETGVSYTRALRHVTSAHSLPGADQQPADAMPANQIPRRRYFQELSLWIQEAGDHLNDAVAPARETYYLAGATPEVHSVGAEISYAMEQAWLLLHEAMQQIDTVSDSFQDTDGKDDVGIPAPAVVFGERYGDAEHCILADSEQPTVHDLRAIFDGVPYQAWADRFGPPNSNSATEWVLRTMAGPATIYRPEPVDDQAIPLSKVTTWHIGGHSNKVVGRLQSCLKPGVQFATRDEVWSVEGPNGGLNVFSELAYQLNEASIDLRDVQAWNESDWMPDGAELPAEAAAARNKIANLIEHAQTIVSEAAELAQPMLTAYRQSATRRGDIPTAKFLQYLGIQTGTEINIAKLWKRRKIGELWVPIGLHADGTPQFLDLNEQADHGDGPHGLVLGWAGSGKSVLLETIALGLFTKSSPDAVQAIFWDANGEGVFDDLADWPHVCAVFKGLELDTFERKLLELLCQRAEAFAGAARQIKGVPFRSLREYNEARATQAGVNLPPVPSTVVFVDGLSRLLKERPSFGDVLYNAARSSRFLGVHLVFASHPLTGLGPAAEQIVQNTRFRIDLDLKEPGTGDFRYAPDAKAVRYRGFQFPESTRMSIGQQVAAANAARQ